MVFDFLATKCFCFLFYYLALECTKFCFLLGIKMLLMFFFLGSSAFASRG